MPPSFNEDDIKEALREMLVAGSRPRPPVTASELRLRTERRRWPRVDPKALVAVAAVLVLIVVLFTAGPFRHSRPSASSSKSRTPAAWIAHSAYGLQLSVPRSWSVQVFGQCPDGTKPGSLFLGTAEFLVQCPEFGSNTDTVSMSDSGPELPLAPYRTIWVHGLTVQAAMPEGNGLVTTAHWYLPSRHVTINGTGSRALAVMRTLAPATGRALPATGSVHGTAQGTAPPGTVVAIPASGSVTIVTPSSRKVRTVVMLDDQYSFTAPPGRYVLTAHVGGVACTPVTVRVASAEQVNAPPVSCRGS